MHKELEDTVYIYTDTYLLKKVKDILYSQKIQQNWLKQYTETCLTLLLLPLIRDQTKKLANQFKAEL